MCFIQQEAQIGRRLAHGISRNFRRACNDYRSDRSSRCPFSQEQKSGESHSSPHRRWAFPKESTESNAKENPQASARTEFGECPIRPVQVEEIIKLISDGASAFFQSFGKYKKKYKFQ